MSDEDSRLGDVTHAFVDQRFSEDNLGVLEMNQHYISYTINNKYDGRYWSKAYL